MLCHFARVKLGTLLIHCQQSLGVLGSVFAEIVKIPETGKRTCLDMLQCATISQTSEFLVALFGPDPRNIKDPHLQMKPYGFRDAEKRPARHLSSLCHLYTLDAGDALVAKLFFHKISMSKHIPRKFQVLKYWENYWGNFQFKESYSPNSKVFNPNLGPHQAGLT